MSLQKQKYKFTVLILNYNKIELARQRMAEAISYLVPRDDTETILVDNGSIGSEISEMFVLNAQEYDNLRAFRIMENQGFGAGFNGAAKIAEGDVLVLYSNDVIMQRDFLDGELGERIYQHCMAGGLACHRIIDWNSGWNTFGGKTIKYGEGYWLALSQEMWKEVRGFDTRYYPFDYEDIDLSVEVERSAQGKADNNISLNIVQAFPSLPIAHTGAATIGYSTKRKEQTIKMRALFAEKWNLENIPERP